MHYQASCHLRWVDLAVARCPSCVPPRALHPTFELLDTFKKKKKKASRGVTDTTLYTLYRKMALLGCAALVLEKIPVRTDIFQNFHEVC